jgi:hypothetical protein
MAELPGQMDILQAILDELSGEPTAARAIKVIGDAQALGWTLNPAASFMVRLTREDGLPFFARWDFSVSESGKRSWRFHGARAANGQPLAFNDIKAYLNDPRVIEPEMPDEMCEAAEYDNPDQTIKGALGAVAAISKPDPAYINGPPARPALADWGAIFS